MAGLRYLSVCSGIESVSVAWEPLGFKPVAFAEIAAFPSRVLAHRWPDVPNLGDFTAINVATLGPVDLLVGGTPCQAFSVAGRRKSLADARGNLSLAFGVLVHELARANGLRWAVWENVPGVLSMADNAFGCLLGELVGADDAVPLPRGAERWPDAGLVAGPRARAAWRILDAQYFGLAQRRRRVFVVVGLGDGADPAAVLFERHGLRRHPPSRGEAGADVAGALAPGSGGGCGPDDNDAQPTHLIPQAFGGNDTRGPIKVSTALNAHGAPHGRQDFESETFVLAPPLTSNPYGDHESREGLLVVHTLRGEGFDASEDGTGCGTPIVPICFDPRQADVLVHGNRTGPLDTQFPGPAICFDTTQITHRENRCNPQPGDPSHPLAAGAHPPAIAFSCKDHGQDVGHKISPTLRSMSREHKNAGGQIAIVDLAWAVRRLTPTECHRLQGFPDDHCAIPGAKDGPIYMALGNSMAVPVLRWIGARIAAADAAISSILQAAE